MPGIFAADTYCDSCIEAIKERLRKDATPEELADWDSGDERNWDSGEYPKYMGDDEESDSPCHCGSHDECLEAEVLSDGSKIGALLSTNLTSDGMEYVKEQVADGGLVADFWREQFDYIDFPKDDDEEEEEEFSDPEEGDYTTEDHRHFYQNRKLVVTVGEEDDWRPAVKAHMEAEQFWPNVWLISDHGNAHLLSMDDETPA